MALTLQTFETHDAARIEPLSQAEGAGIAVPSDRLFEGRFERAGPDLRIEIEGEPTRLITDYFRDGTPDDLIAPNGAVLRGGLVERLAGPEAPGQWAQQGTAPQPQLIGQVETLTGDAAVQRTDGTRVTLDLKTPIFLGDVLETADDTILSVTFVDGTIFTLAANARMVIDELIYNPGQTDNSATFSLIQGGFVFIAGQIAPTGGMEVETPAATMGIRGTTVLADIQSDNGIITVELALTRDLDGTLGRIEVFDLDGNPLAEITGTETKWVLSPQQGLALEVPRSTDDIASDSILIAEASDALRAALGRVQAGEEIVPGATPAPPPPGGGLPPVVALASAADALGGGGGSAPVVPVSFSPPAPAATPPAPGGPEGGLDALEETDTDPDQTVFVFNGIEDAPDGIEGALPPPMGGAVYILMTSPTDGTVTLQPDGSFVYFGAADFNGQDGFTYRVEIDGEAVRFGEAIINVAPVNDAPVLEDVGITTPEDSAITGEVIGTDVDGDALSYRLADPASNGDVTILSDGTYRYVPDADFNGTDSFVVEVDDGAGGTDLATVTVTVTPVNDAPVVTSGADDAAGALVEDGPSAVTGGQLAASDADTGASLTWSGGETTALGVFAITGDGAWSYTLDNDAAQALAAGQEVTETTEVTVSDGQGGSATQTLSVTITGTNDAPVVTSGADDAAGALVEDGP
ncbi:tandem-95 repeat protein, partial [Dinoroseobacter sp. S76]|uniref:tandem-95 repeat protein n=1 Tax=Dinoroseobacter sp. S76 TaxID=3415124 RepID=UPI003C7ABE3B